MAAFKSNRAMSLFAKTMIQARGATIKNEGNFNGMVTYYSGEKSVQSYDKLVQELAGQKVSKVLRQQCSLNSSPSNLAPF